MKNISFTLIHSCDVSPVIENAPSPFVPSGTFYLMPTPTNQEDFQSYLKTVYQAEKEKAEWIRKYENVLNGLNYWREKALEI